MCVWIVLPIFVTDVRVWPLCHRLLRGNWSHAKFVLETMMVCTLVSTAT